MSVIFKISLRNLVRQKRRNILLGTAIAFGTMILILASAFSHGISDVLFNQIVVYVSGHVSVNYSENGNLYKQVFHNATWAKELAKKEIPDISTMQEAIGVMARAIGNGRADNVIMVGMDLTQEGSEKEKRDAENNFKMISGSFEDLGNKSIENPVLIAEVKAKYLNVKKGDVIRVRYSTITGQNQAARLTVAGIFKPANIFMSAPIFLEINDLKQVLGYGPNDMGNLYITIKDPKRDAKKYADKLQQAFKPSLAGINGTGSFNQNSFPVTVLGFKADSVSRAMLNKAVQLTDRETFGKEDVAISESLATALRISKGEYITVDYPAKYNEKTGNGKFKITRFFKSNENLPGNVVLSNDLDFYKVFYNEWPEDLKKEKGAFVPDDKSPILPVLTETWTLMQRVKSTTELTKLQREIGQKKLKGSVVSVQSMYESASAVLSLEGALNLITFAAVMILFFIILIGVVNTLRMTIRERTREIGTVRAIGMQKRDVRMSFVLETFFLTLFSAVIGTLLAFLAMFGLSSIKMEAQDNPLGMLLSNGHLNFAPTVTSVIFYICLIIMIAVVTAYFPARKAASLSSAEALRHFE